MSYIDFTEVKDRISIEVAADMLGLELKEKSGQLRGPCPVCEKGGPRAMCITPSKQKWYCFGCQTGGDQIALAAHIRGEHPKEAAHFLMGTDPEERGGNQRPKATTQQKSNAFSPLDYLEPEHDAVEALGISPLDAGEIGIGYAKRGVGRGSVMIPIRLECGSLIGYVAVQELTYVPETWHFPEEA